MQLIHFFKRTEVIMEDLVSVIVPCYKNFDGIENTVESIYRQDYGNIEIIVSDDGSPDFESRKDMLEKILGCHGDNITNTVISHLPENAGTVKNCNSALGLAGGKYVKLLPPGDEFYSASVISDCVALLENMENTLLVGRTFCRNRNGENTGEYRNSVLYRYRARSGRKSIITPTLRDIRYIRNLSERKRSDLIKSRCIISTVSVFFPMEILKATNGFTEDYRLLEDMPYWPCLASRGVHFEFTELVMVLYSLGGISNSGVTDSPFFREYKRVMNEVYIENDSRFGIFNSRCRALRRKMIEWTEKKSTDNSMGTKLKNLDVILIGLYKNIKYLLFDTKL